MRGKKFCVPNSHFKFFALCWSQVSICHSDTASEFDPQAFQYHRGAKKLLNKQQMQHRRKKIRKKTSTRLRLRCQIFPCLLPLASQSSMQMVRVARSAFVDKQTQEGEKRRDRLLMVRGDKGGKQGYILSIQE